MKGRSNFELHHPTENMSIAMIRLRKRLRSLQGNMENQSYYAMRIQSKKAHKHLRLIK